MTTTALRSDAADTPQGFTLAVSAYLLWGLLPLYLKALDHVPPVEVVAHRILWALPIAAIVVVWLGRTADFLAALRSPRMLAMTALTAALISVNWGVYVWAIVTGNALEASLGYYVNPIFSIFLGAVLLRERLSRLQWGAVALAALAVTVLIVDGGTVPWAGLAMMATFGFYAFFKRSLPIGPNQAFLLEIVMLMPAALAYVVWLEARGTGNLFASPADTLLLIGCGAVTAIPLILYGNGAKRLRLSTIAILQYIAPTMIMLIAVFVFAEPFGRARAIAFPMIWAALILYTWSIWRGRHGR